MCKPRSALRSIHLNDHNGTVGPDLKSHTRQQQIKLGLNEIPFTTYELRDLRLANAAESSQASSGGASKGHHLVESGGAAVHSSTLAAQPHSTA